MGRAKGEIDKAKPIRWIAGPRPGKIDLCPRVLCSRWLSETNHHTAQVPELLEADLIISDKAINRLEGLIASKENSDLKFRVYIQGGGCSGFQYGFQFEEEAAMDDLEFKRSGVQVVVDPMSIQYLKGAEIDFIDDLQGSRFVVNNPNATTTCGCGASFGI